MHRAYSVVLITVITAFCSLSGASSWQISGLRQSVCGSSLYDEFDIQNFEVKDLGPSYEFRIALALRSCDRALRQPILSYAHPSAYLEFYHYKSMINSTVIILRHELSEGPYHFLVIKAPKVPGSEPVYRMDVFSPDRMRIPIRLMLN